MDSEKVKQFISLAGQEIARSFVTKSPDERKLGAHLLLSEVLEYVIDGLGVTPEVEGVAINDPENVRYSIHGEPDKRAMLDGLADVAYTMYWNAVTFGVPLEQGFERVCDNNLEKFVELDSWAAGLQRLAPQQWDCRKDVRRPAEVVTVEVVPYDGKLFAVGKDARGKVRKPSTYTSVDLTSLVG